ncbi:MAG: cytochrome d ubiquinol oxidase subunit II [Myxococcota bacterium]
MTAEWLVYFVMGAALVAYVVTGGADFGGGVWDLLASGPRKQLQRAAVAHAIAPIWEANHVWLIFLIVLLFTVFPTAFATIGVALHFPIVLTLIGITLRGTAFTFRAYGLQPDSTRLQWGRVFGWSSALTPIFMGMCLGALGTGDIRVVQGEVITGSGAGWTTLFAVLVGLFALVLFALLAAVYLTYDTEGDVREDFRTRAILSEGIAFLMASAVFSVARSSAPKLYEGLARSPWTWPLQVATATAAIGVIASLWRRRYGRARFWVVMQVALVVAGWGAAMDGHLVLPDVEVGNAGARSEVISAVVPMIGLGSALLAPSLWLLFRLFKRPSSQELQARERSDEPSGG